MRKKLIIWDWNGTLLDDLDLCVALLNRMTGQFGDGRRYDRESYRAIFGFPIRDYYVRAGIDFSHQSYEELAAEYMTHYIPESRACSLNVEAGVALSLARQAGLRQTVLSASPRTTLLEQVAERGIGDYFEELLGLGDIYANSKVELGRDYIRRCGLLPAEAMMVGDTTHDLEVAEAIGVDCVLYAGGHQPAALLAATRAPVAPTLLGAVSEVMAR